MTAMQPEPSRPRTGAEARRSAANPTGKPRRAEQPLALLSTVSRGSEVESVHHGSVVIVDGDRVWSTGDPDAAVWTRSVVKPFQAVASLERGIDERHGLSPAEIAVMSSSHDSQPIHVDTVRSMLGKLGLEEDAFLCGPHAPYDKKANIAIARSGGKPQRIHNNCSGKHSGLLWLARELGVPLADYLDPESASQRAIRSIVSDFTDVPEGRIQVAIDGCGAPTFRVPLVALARAFAKFMNPVGMSDVRQAACARLRSAISRHPIEYSGDVRICSPLIRSLPDRVVPKNGAEGVYAVGYRKPDGSSLGFAVKIADGAERGYYPVVVDVLKRLRAWPAVPKDLEHYECVPIRNTQKKVVGELRSVVEFPKVLFPGTP